MGAIDVQPPEAPARPGTRASRLQALAGRPWLGLLVVIAIALAMGWQFITDASRAVPAFDTAYYQWRVEFLMNAEPGAMIELRGAVGALAGGYRIAEPVLAATMRTVGGVDAAVPTVVLSIFFRILAGAAMAAFAWKHRRNWLLFYLTLVAVPALFLLQRFFGYMDNFMSLALLGGVLLLMDRLQDSWGARVAATLFMFLTGLSHPTTLAIFLLSMGALAVLRFLRERSLLPALRSEGMIIVTGTVAVIMTSAFWLGGLWGPQSSFGDAAVPPPADVEYFVNRSLSVLKSLEPFYPLLILIPLMVLGLAHLVVRVVRRKEYLAELTVGWTLPLLGMLGFVIGAAYPYFRFFNATLAPELLASVGLFLVIWGATKLGSVRQVATVVAVVAVGFVLATWWSRGLSAWNAGGTWLTPEVRGTTAAASAYLRTTPEDEAALFVVDAQGAAPLPYGEYKNFANAIYAGIDGAQIDDVSIYYGTVEDLEAGRASTIGDEVYDEIAADTARDALPALEGDRNVVVFLPTIMNEETPNADVLAACPSETCVEVGDTGLFVLPEVSGTPVDQGAVEAASVRATEARSFAKNPPGPFSGLGGTILSFLRLVLLFVIPGWLFYRRLDRRSWPEAVALIPLFSVASLTTVGVILVAILQDPFTAATGWWSWAIAVAVALFWRPPEGLRRRRDRVVAVPARIIDDASELFRNRSFTALMGAQWLGQMADGLVATALAKLITFRGAAGFDPESARTPREAPLISLPAVLGERDLLQGNSISQAGSAVFQLVGAGAAFVASAAVGTPVILAVGVVVYVLATGAAWFTGSLGYATRVTPLRQEVGRIFRDMLEGFREVARRAAAGLALTSFLVIRTLLTFTVLATEFISREFVVEQSTSTAVAGAVGALGAVAGFVTAATVRRRVRPIRIVTGALVLGGAGMLAFGGIINLAGISLMAFTVGISFFLGKVGVDTMMQEALADSYRGRGFSLQDIAYNFSWIIPALVLFLFLTPAVARTLMIAAGVTFLALAVLIALWARRVPATSEPARAT